MSSGPDWSRLEGSVRLAADRLRALQEENRTLRAEVARLEGELETARAAPATSGGERAAEVRRRLERLEGEIQALLPTATGRR